ncbi:hypothetical protein BT96DRAFT_986361 [Gymnopus androsaceus JB14]|uniref:Uncharacterized protein n=1 Tax=Gymnopus androsaceus JB14 TaxID=1447944 RepID=A0A6A4IAM7_9AGAR|nr:hypothetical protein BT96DRAFT_986361 [Gymnopus androsaceus JB14]
MPAMPPGLPSQSPPIRNHFYFFKMEWERLNLSDQFSYGLIQRTRWASQAWSQLTRKEKAQYRQRFSQWKQSHPNLDTQVKCQRRRRKNTKLSWPHEYPPPAPNSLSPSSLEDANNDTFVVLEKGLTFENPPDVPFFNINDLDGFIQSHPAAPFNPIDEYPVLARNRCSPLSLKNINMDGTFVGLEKGLTLENSPFFNVNRLEGLIQPHPVAPFNPVDPEVSFDWFPRSLTWGCSVTGTADACQHHFLDNLKLSFQGSSVNQPNTILRPSPVTPIPIALLELEASLWDEYLTETAKEAFGFSTHYALNFEMSGQLSPSPITPALSLSLEWEGITSYLVLDEPVSASEVSQVRFPDACLQEEVALSPPNGLDLQEDSVWIQFLDSLLLPSNNFANTYPSAYAS